MTKKPNNIGIILYAMLFAASVAAVLAALVCMFMDAHIWHTLMPPALAAAAVTGVAFVVSIILYRQDVLKVRSENPSEETEKEISPADKRRASIAKGFKIAAIACFLCAIALNVAGRFCNGITSLMLQLFSVVATFTACGCAIVAVALGRRCADEKTALIGFISIPFILLIMFAVAMAVIGGVLLYIMILSWAQWGML